MEKKCRFCGEKLVHSFADLGMSPISNAYVKAENLNKKESFYPLQAYVCEKCFLVQLETYESPEEIFSDYAYFSSYSHSWLIHCAEYADLMTARLGLNGQSQVIELASNDGYLLQYFKKSGIPVLGIEPAANVAQYALDQGIETQVDFFGEQLAECLSAEGIQADLLIANNVLAHVPDLNDFIAGMNKILKPNGVITIEFPHLLTLMQKNEFDTIYHEHFSYFSFLTVIKIFAAHGLRLFDVEEISTHGGSLRIYACHDAAVVQTNERVLQLLHKEKEIGLNSLEPYRRFKEQVKTTKRKLLELLITLKESGASIAGYGAPAKGNTLLNYCGIGKDFIDFTVDVSPHKQGMFLPGTHIPIHSPERLREAKPDYVLILPWNLKEEITTQIHYIHEWGGKFIIPIPCPEVVDP